MLSLTFLMSWQREVAVPARNKHHVITKVFSLNLELLHNHDIRLQDIEHAIECALVPPWLEAEWVTNAIHVPGSDSEDHGDLAPVRRAVKVGMLSGILCCRFYAILDYQEGKNDPIGREVMFLASLGVRESSKSEAASTSHWD